MEKVSLNTENEQLGTEDIWPTVDKRLLIFFFFSLPHSWGLSLLGVEASSDVDPWVQSQLSGKIMANIEDRKL